MSETVSDFLLRRLREWGVERVYGYPGDGINAILGAFDRAGTTRVHPGAARGDGRVHGLRPRQVHRRARRLPGDLRPRRDPPPERPLRRQARPSAGARDRRPAGARRRSAAATSRRSTWSRSVQGRGPRVRARWRPTRRRSATWSTGRCGSRRDQRTVTCIIIPNDLASQDAVETPPRAHGTIHSSVGYSRPVVVPTAADLRAGGRDPERRRAGGDAGRRRRARRRATRCCRSAELLGAGVAKALLGKAVLPDDLPFVTGSIGLLGTKPSWEMMSDCDTLLMVGSSFPYSEFLPRRGRRAASRSTSTARMIGIRYPMEVAPGRRLGGDAARADAAARAQGRPLAGASRSRRTSATGGELMEERAMHEADPINPQRVFCELSKRLPDSAILTLRLRLGRQLVCARHRLREGHDGVALRQPGDDGPGGAVRDRGEVRVPGPAGRSRSSVTARCR